MTVKILADSISPKGDRLTTLVATYPRFIHDEMLTHRSFSRNVTSSRALTVQQFIKDSIDNPVKIHYMKDQRGMAASENLEEPELSLAKFVWGKAHEAALLAAQTLSELGTHKQLANRLLMPFVNVNTIISATDWDNFFKLRTAPDAQQEIKEPAELIKQALSESTPKLLNYGDWHLPLVEEEEYKQYDLPILRELSAARCARVSYNNHEKPFSHERQLGLTARLIESGHFSPLEHQATPKETEGKVNNFTGWLQFRNVVQGNK